MTDLPSELIAAILKFLDPLTVFKFGAVNQKAASVIRIGKLWEYVNLNGFDEISEEVRDVLISVGPSVKSFVINRPRFSNYNPARLSLILSNCINLTELDISNCRMIEDLDFLDCTPNLTKLAAKSLICVDTDCFKEKFQKLKNLIGFVYLIMHVMELSP